jgi:twitching motility protein PilT
MAISDDAKINFRVETLRMSDPPQIELVREWDDQDKDDHPKPARGSLNSAQLDAWLGTLVERKGSDLLLVPGAPACIRVEGAVKSIGSRMLVGGEIEAAVVPALAPHALRAYRDTRIGDSSYRPGKLGRFRINLHREKGQPAACIRALPTAVPVFDDLHLPVAVRALARLPRGLVLIGGAAGSGKTTTMAALIHEINRNEARHIVTIEDPIEYEHTHIQSIVEQVEIGIDAPDYPSALRAALRQAPDVVVIGEMRDPESMRIAVAAAETGHLVFSTLHATDVAGTVSRIADSFAGERQHTIRQELAMALGAVLTQILLPSKGGGIVPAAELLMVGYGARQHIRKNALQHLHQEIAITRKTGSFALEESLLQLMNQDLIHREDALACALHPEDLDVLRKR